MLVCALIVTPIRASDLLDAYNLARAGDPVVLQAMATREVVRESVAQARAPLLPQVSAGVSWSQTQYDTADAASAARSNSRNRAITLNQTILDLSRLATLRASKAQASSADGVYRAAQLALPVRVATAYINVLVAAEVLAYVQANEDALAEQVRNANAGFEAGQTALVDLDQARAYYASARANTINSGQLLAAARESLTQIIGTPMNELKTLRDDVLPIPPQPADPVAWFELALQKNPMLQAQRDTVAAAEFSIESARAGHLPTLSASVGVGVPATWPSDGSTQDGRRSTTFSLALSMPLFSGGMVQSQVRQMIAQRSFSEQVLESQRRQLLSDVQNDYRNILADIQQMATTREAVDSAKSALAATRVGRQAGTQTMTDLLLAIQLLAVENIAHAQVRHKFVIDQLILRQTAGVLTDDDLIALNTQLH